MKEIKPDSSSLGRTDDNADVSYKGIKDDILCHGFWVQGGKNIAYFFGLNWCTYYANKGFFEWLNTQRYMKITVSSNGKKLESKTFILLKNDTRNRQSVKYTLTSSQIITDNFINKQIIFLFNHIYLII